jgi:hypothetical protein
MNDLIARNPRNKEIIRPFIGGEEINSDPAQRFHRYVIDFGDMSEADARKWPELMSIVEQKVLPERRDKSGGYSQRWWQFGRRNVEGQLAIKGLPRVLVSTQVGPHLSFSFQPTDRIFAHTVNIFADASYAFFSVVQSRVHEVWARFFGSSMKDDLRYTPTDCFETFPFPKDFSGSFSLDEQGREYYEFRTAIMFRCKEGLTKTYNRFHDPEERDSEIERLRALHLLLDRAVVASYGWTDIQPRCEFLLDYEFQETEENGPRRRKKPWRYRWPDEIRDEVLARLLELNRVRAEGEQITAVAAEANSKPIAIRKLRQSAKGKGSRMGNLLTDTIEEGKS